MLKKFSLVILFLVSLKIYSQENVGNDYIITISNDTVFGQLENFNYLKTKKTVLTTNEGEKVFKFIQIKVVNSNNQKYIRQHVLSLKNNFDTIYFNHFAKPLVEGGSINAFQFKKNILLTKNRKIFLKKDLKYFADDFHATSSFLKQKHNTDSLIIFINNYNTFHDLNPDSQSFYEKNLHYKKIFTTQLSINFIGIIPSYGYVGAELRASNSFTFVPRISCMLAKINKEDKNPQLIPFAELGAKYYFLNNNRIKHDRITYMYSGYNLTVTFMQPLKDNIVRVVRMEGGYKGVYFNNFYIDYNIGVLYTLENKETNLWTSVGAGYCF